ncbi:hypothetical protein V8B97DRAFT_2068522 [Scleroderma yunnanense]
MSSSKAGHCKQVALNKLPVLMASEITPEALQAWEMGCLQFFQQKEIVEKDQVGKVTWNLQDVCVCNWYNHDCNHLNFLIFEDFMKEVQSYWLPSDWATWSHMHIDLIMDYCSANVAAEKDLHKWIEKVRLLDEKHLHDAAKIEMAMKANHQLLQSSCLVNAKSKDSKPATDGKPCTCIPPLITEEQQLLQDNAGCFKCCWFFQSHTTPICPNDFPDAKGYFTLTMANVEAAHSKKHAKPVATIMDNEPALKHSHSMEEQSLKPIAVIILSAALGSGLKSADECIAPLTVPHFHWSCLIDGPNLDLTLHIDALIDNRSHLALIDQALVKRLGLCLHPLHKPLDVSVVMSHGGHTTLTFKDSGYDLLNPLAPLLVVNIKAVEQHDWKMEVIQELRCLLPELKDRVNASCEPTLSVAVVPAVQHHIKQLAVIDDLQK